MLQHGQFVGDDYLLQKILAQGPCGVVWRALDQKQGQLVAVRFLPEAFRMNSQAMDRFRRHFSAAQTFRHPHVVRPERLVENSPDGLFWVARFVEGPLLEEYASQWTQAEGQFPFRLIFDVLRPIASALDEARANNLACRNLSSRSVVVSPMEGLQILGFDLSGLVRESLDPTPLISKGERSRFLAPEQIDGQGVSLSTDQYSLGVIAYELFGGQHQIAGGAPLPLADQPEFVNLSLQRAMHRDPMARFPSCQHFLDGLAGITPVSPQPLAVVSLPGAEPSTVQDSTTLMPTIPSSSETPVETLPIAPPLEAISSFEQIASAASRAKATSITQRIHQERRLRRLFHLWNVMVLIVVLIVAFLFRDRLLKAWNQHVARSTASESTEPSDDGADTNTPERKPTDRTPKTTKEIESSEPEDSPSASLAVTNSPDRVWFVGTVGVGKRIVFVIDASEAMGGGKQTPLAHARKEISFSFQNLNESQRFQVVYFNETASTLPTEGTDLMIPVSPSNLRRAQTFLETITGTGRGDPSRALLEAISLKPDLIFFLSDENAVQLDAAQIQLVRQKANGIPIHGVEIGSGEEPADPTPIKTLTTICQGRFQWVNASSHSLSRLKRVFSP